MDEHTRLTTAHAARVLRVSPRHCRRLVSTGALSAARLSDGQLTFVQADVFRLARARMDPPLGVGDARGGVPVAWTRERVCVLCEREWPRAPVVSSAQLPLPLMALEGVRPRMAKAKIGRVRIRTRNVAGS
jgi:hypothetical protein